VLDGGGTALDAVEAVIRSLEDDASFNAGRGAVLTREGNAELDASIMDGKTRACGAVAGVTRIKNPITAARAVMTETKHVLLGGDGADAFAKAQGLETVQPDYFLSDRRWKDPKQESPHYGTVGCVALDTHGNLAAGTSTGGTSKKLPGRIGDSPIVGAGTFADNPTCAVSGTGIGEEYIRNAVAYDVAAQMRYAGRSLQSAVSEIMTDRLNPGTGGIISVGHDGTIVMQHNTPGMSCGAADSGGRFEFFLQLKNGGQPE
jgi:beta-aspartyl-peptidase (threonine type)